MHLAALLIQCFLLLVIPNSQPKRCETDKIINKTPHSIILRTSTNNILLTLPKPFQPVAHRMRSFPWIPKPSWRLILFLCIVIVSPAGTSTTANHRFHDTWNKENAKKAGGIHFISPPTKQVPPHQCMTQPPTPSSVSIIALNTHRPHLGDD